MVLTVLIVVEVGIVVAMVTIIVIVIVLLNKKLPIPRERLNNWDVPHGMQAVAQLDNPTELGTSRLMDSTGQEAG